MGHGAPSASLTARFPGSRSSASPPSQVSPVAFGVARPITVAGQRQDAPTSLHREVVIGIAPRLGGRKRRGGAPRRSGSGGCRGGVGRRSARRGSACRRASARRPAPRRGRLPHGTARHLQHSTCTLGAPPSARAPQGATSRAPPPSMPTPRRCFTSGAGRPPGSLAAFPARGRELGRTGDGLVVRGDRYRGMCRHCRLVPP